MARRRSVLSSSPNATPRPVGLSISLLACTLTAGLVTRFAPLGLPSLVVKYGGSMLWALAIYWIVTSLIPRRSLPFAAFLTYIIATSVECLKLYRDPALDAFRLTLPGMLLLGRFFSWWDIVAYWTAITAGCLLDAALRRLLTSRA